MKGHLPCKASKTGVGLQECIDAFRDADALRRTDSPCFACPLGRQRRGGVARDNQTADYESRTLLEQAEELLKRKFGLELTQARFDQVLDAAFRETLLPFIAKPRYFVPPIEREEFVLWTYRATAGHAIAICIRKLPEMLQGMFEELGQFLAAQKNSVVRSVGDSFKARDVAGLPAEDKFAARYTRHRVEQVLEPVEAAIASARLALDEKRGAQNGEYVDCQAAIGGGARSKASRKSFGFKILYRFIGPTGELAQENTWVRDHGDAWRKQWAQAVALIWFISRYYSDESTDDEENLEELLKRVERRVRKDLGHLAKDLLKGVVPSRWPSGF